MDESYSKTVRIDLMPERETASTVSGRNDLLAKANWSTRRRQAAVAAETVRSRYEDLLESVYDAAVISSPSGRIIDVNGRAVEFLGYSREQLCGMCMTDIIEGADETVMRDITETLLSERFALLQAFCCRQDESKFPAEIAVNRLSMDNMRLCFFIRDVSVRYEAQEMLRMEHAAVQNCASGIAICDTEGGLVYANPAFTEMLGWESEALPGREMRTMLGDSDGVDRLIACALSGDQTWMSEFEMKTPDERMIFLQVSVACCRRGDASPCGIVFAIADITLRKRMEDAAEAGHAEMEARVKARTRDLLEINDRLQTRIQDLEKELESRPSHLLKPKMQQRP